jgi:uncharacterized repeat protein (TIGR01451 family)
MHFRQILFIFTSLLLTTQVFANTKVMIKKGEININKMLNVKPLHDYGSYQLFNMDEESISQLGKNGIKYSVLKDSDYLLFDAKRFNTQKLNKNIKPSKNLSSDGLQIIQFTGPIKQEWLTSLESFGINPIHYVANNGYLIWLDSNSMNQLNNSSTLQSVIQYQANYDESFKKAASIDVRIKENTDENEEINIIVQLVDSPFLSESKEFINNLTLKAESTWQHVMKFHSIRITVQIKDLQKILDMQDSYWIGESFERTLDDEVQNQILVADFVPDNSAPAMTGYADFLSSRGFPTNPALYPVVDVTDEGIGNGTVNSNDPTFHESGDLSNPTRLAYVSNCTSNANGEAVGSHGHLNLNIVGGFESRVGFPFVDPNGYIRTQGVNPFARLAGTRIFGPGFDLSGCGGNDAGLIQSVQNDGAQIMNNSWGCSGCAGSYDDSSQAFDLGVRDADLTQPGNQELIMLISAGNSGPSAATVGTPGNGKNMITVGASENFRPDDEDGPWTDGCAIGPTGADDAMDVIGFSSRGPSPGGRTKPEIIAPGTHIHGTISTGPNNDGSGTCDALRPSGQAIIGASSGTSHSAPAAAGVASLIYYWLESNKPNTLPAGSITPSSALMKAYMMAHPTYLTGDGANGNLPSNSQGFGMPNLDIMFDDVNKFVVNQTVILDNSGEQWTWSGSAVDPAKPVRIAMAYTDQPGAVGTSPQVNNLDLSVETNGDTYLGNNFTSNFSSLGGASDALNNYEAVFFDAGTATDITITVSGTNIAGDGIPNIGDATDQDFAIVCYNCAQEPTFTLQSTPSNIEVCSPDDAVYDFDIGSILNFVTPVNLTVSGEPAGSSASLLPTTVTPPGTSVLTVSNTGAATAGSYTLTVNGVAGVENKSRDVELSIFGGVPAVTVTTLPVDDATLVDSAAVLFNWDAIPFATTYDLEIATDESFTAIVHSVTVNTNSATVANVLNSNTEYFWRVKGSNICGAGTNSLVFSFTTSPLPGDCPISTTSVIIESYDFESGAQGWVSGTNLGIDTWTLSTTNPSPGSSTQHWHVDDQAPESDTFLTSPVISLPLDKSPLTFQFNNYQELEDNNTTACWDGGLLEMKVNAGSFIQVDNSLLGTDPYDGVFSSTSNPLTGQQGWCGDPQDYLNSIVDINANAGDDVQFRFRIVTDSTVDHPGWDIDDVVVKGCEVVDLAEITVTKTAVFTTDNGNIGEADLGDVIEFNVSVQNTGTVALTSLVVNDSMQGALACTPLDLAPTESATCSAYTYTVLESDIITGGTIDNTANASMNNAGNPDVLGSASTQTVINVVLFKDGFE